MTRRRLGFYEPGSAGDFEDGLRAARASGVEGVVLRGTAAPSWIEDAVSRAGMTQLPDTRGGGNAPPGGADMVIITPGEDDPVAAALHALLPADVAVLAPITGNHFSRRVVYLFSIPKAGTHMMLRLFDLLGLRRSADRHPEPGTWCTPVGYQYHAPCRELLAGDWFEPVGRQLFLRSPGVFVYRHPLDIVLSELDWFVKPEHAFSGYLNGMADDDERLGALISDPTVMGSIRERILRYAGWIRFPNLCAVSYEELVGSRGRGSDREQADTIWSLLLKLQIPGDPEDLAARLYDPGSATFSRGMIGRHMERFTAAHFAAVASLPQDFLNVLGYRPGEPMSSRVADLRSRRLDVKRLDARQLHTARLVRETAGADNIVEIAGRYHRVRQGQQILTAEDARAIAAGDDGFATIDDALLAAGNALPPSRQDAAVTRGSFHLAEEGFLGFNLLHDGVRWIAARQSAGPLDLDALDEESLSRMEARGMLIQAETESALRDRVLAGEFIVSRGNGDALAQRVESALTGLEPLRREIDLLSTRLAGDVEPLHGRMAGLSTAMETVARHVAAWLPPDNPEQGLVVEGFAGFNLVRMADGWLAADQALGPTDLASLEPERRRELVEAGMLASGTTIMGTLGSLIQTRLDRLHKDDGALRGRLNQLEELASRLAARLEDAEAGQQRSLAAIQEAIGTLSARLPPDPPVEGVLETGYFGFDILRACGRWYGSREGQRPDLTAESMSAAVTLGHAVEGDTVIAVKAAILGIALRDAAGREQTLSEALREAVREIREHRHGRVE